MSESAAALLDQDDVEAVIGTTERRCYHTDPECRHVDRIRDPRPVEDPEQFDVPECERCAGTAAAPPEVNPWEREQALDALDPSDVGLSPLVDEEQDGGRA